MKPMMKCVAIMLCLAPLSALALAEDSENAQKDLKLFDKGAEWKFGIGKPAGKGSFELGKDGEKPIGAVKYDFSGGGDYVYISTDSVEIPETRELRVKVRTEVRHRVTIRFTDATGQSLQYKTPIKAGDWQQVVIPLDKKAEHWGGANDGKIHFPIRLITLSVPSPEGETKTGKMEFADITIPAAAK